MTADASIPKLVLESVENDTSHGNKLSVDSKYGLTVDRIILVDREPKSESTKTASKFCKISYWPAEPKNIF